MKQTDAKTRSRMMAGIKGRNTKPEIAVRKTLHALGYRFRIHRRDLPGNPDVVLPKYHLAVLIHGCFWHQHPRCRYAVLPKSNVLFWSEKLAGNIKRDNKVLRQLRDKGWRTLVIWECSLKRSTIRDQLNTRLDRIVRSDLRAAEIPARLK